MSDTRAHIVILGAGIVGSACADVFVSDGLRVTLIDRSFPGSGATAEGMGHIVAMDGSPEELALSSYSRELWHSLSGSLSSSCEYRRFGTIWIAANDRHMSAVAAKHRVYDAIGIESHILDPAQLYRQEPNLRPGLAGGLLVPDDVVVYPPAVARELVDRAVARGAAAIFGVDVVRVDGPTVYLADRQEITGDVIINALGIGAPRISPHVPVRPRRGHLVITERVPAFVHHQLVELGYLDSAHGTSPVSVAFNVQPRATGQLLIGSSREFDVENSTVDWEILSRMVRLAVDYLPNARSLDAIRAWTGFRPASADGLPYIGPDPYNENVWLATGHEGLGITTALGTAHLLLDQLRGRSTAIPAEPYWPARILEESRGER
ncbi:MAG: FAD-binding oxidoreductase [Spirochaetaceae bacterium]|nr:MAG: FAD-binding oxidoreductase [Spirochaetaceae bacterium]